MRPLLAEIDIPPSWLALHVAVAWVLSFVSPTLFGVVGDWVGKALVTVGIGIMAGAAVQMLLSRTTIIPRRDPNALVTTGLFSLSRNPIYFADALILLGAVLWLDAILALPLVLTFVLLIQLRFIQDEEARLKAAFGADFDDWAARTHRWIGRK
ncbi:methyltransferase family protein [Tabrizicola sp.]|uniref:methyltransferase family protein n=1 Tax=Tabrizicola sp. TaxID=2005166 RepID=UPI003F35DD66